MILNQHIREYLQLLGMKARISGVVLLNDYLTTHPKSREVFAHVVR